jgi:parallel beta-helix repeat protein
MEIISKGLLESKKRAAAVVGAVLVTLALAIMVALLSSLLAAKTAQAVATFTVDRSDDPELTTTPTADDCTAAAANDCSLRGAINAANANNNDPTVDIISFAIPGAGPHTISPTSKLPDIEHPVTIDGYTESTDESTPAKENTLAIGNNAVLKIELNGANAPTNTSGLKITADNSTVKGLVISKWENGVFLGVDATGNTVRGNFLGTDPSGTADLDNNIGVALTNAQNSTIGGTTAAARNIISDNGIGISISGGTDNKVQGNYIGTNAAGNTRLGNNQGVVLSNAPKNTIGGTTVAARNIISGNSTWGVRISDAESTGNTVMGNYIGTDVTGTVTDPDGTPNNGDELGNGLNGVLIQTGAANNIIGEPQPRRATSSPATAPAAPTPSQTR